ncbi:MAG: Rossmann-like and DUF2520 domain-containing protein [Gemmatimonadota bacterium]
MERLFIVGTGRMGLALGHALMRSGEVEELTYSGRHPEPPDHPLFTGGQARYVYGLERPGDGTTVVLLAVPDPMVPEMAEALAGRGVAPQGCCALHLAGGLAVEVLAPLHARGYSVGSIHPFQTVTHPGVGVDRLFGSAFGLSGESEAVQAGRRLARALGGMPLEVPALRRPLYHVAGVLTSNGVLALLDLSADLLGRSGLDPEDARQAVVALALGTLENARMSGFRPAMTGPVVRGDLEAVSLHLRALDPDDAQFYRVLALRILRSAMEAGIQVPGAQEMESLLASGGGPRLKESASSRSPEEDVDATVREH